MRLGGGEGTNSEAEKKLPLNTNCSDPPSLPHFLCFLLVCSASPHDVLETPDKKEGRQSVVDFCQSRRREGGIERGNPLSVTDTPLHCAYTEI